MKATRTDAEWAALVEEHEMAYFRGELATSSPESYSIEEMREISEAMDESTAKVEAAMRDDFNALPPQAQARMLELLAGADPGNMDFWEEVLGLKMPDCPSALA